MDRVAGDLGRYLSLVVSSIAVQPVRHIVVYLVSADYRCALCIASCIKIDAIAAVVIHRVAGYGVGQYCVLACGLDTDAYAVVGMNFVIGYAYCADCACFSIDCNAVTACLSDYAVFYGCACVEPGCAIFNSEACVFYGAVAHCQ